MRYRIWRETAGILIVLSACERDDAPALPTGDIQPSEPVARQKQGALGEEVAAGDRQPVAVRMVDIERFVSEPGGFAGFMVSDTARVGEVISDRGFWLLDGQSRVFAVIHEEAPGSDARVDINQGQTIRFVGLALTRGAMDDVAGHLDPATRAVIEQQPGFIAMHWKDVAILRKGEGAKQP